MSEIEIEKPHSENLKESAPNSEDCSEQDSKKPLDEQNRKNYDAGDSKNSLMTQPEDSVKLLQEALQACSRVENEMMVRWGGRMFVPFIREIRAKLSEALDELQQNS